ncbi:hypothetical protein RI054_01g06610 [Pseudoscourfieldia marina]
MPGKRKRSLPTSFEEARTYARTLGLKSQGQWKAWSKSGKRPDGIPSNPDETYSSSGWTSWGDFLGYDVGKQAKKRKEYESLTFEDARVYVHTLGLKSWEEWEAWSKSGKRPHDIPSAPNRTYASSGWTSLSDFLGYAEGQCARGSFRTFADARTYARTLGLKSWEEWKAWSSSGKRPHDIPGAPDQTYKSSGWTSFGDFLGYAVGKAARNTKESEFRSFEEARTYARTLGLKSQGQWKAWSKSGKRPDGIPSNPDKTYSSSGWTSWGDFLGYDVGKQAKKRKEYESLTFEDARVYVHTLGLKSWEEWEAWSASGKRPHDIPSAPNRTYASSGWTSYPDFLGYAEGQCARGSFRSFEDARAFVRTLGLKSWEEWKAWSSSGKRPHDIPGAPNRTYASSGWTSLSDFLGYAEGQCARGSFRSFEDARAFVRTLGLKNQKQWKAWSKSGKRPHDIPGAPEKTYRSSGWLSLGDFLGFADGKVAAGSFRTFADARTYARTLGLKSKEEWQAWSASGARPHDIPSTPDRTYASSGWLSLGDFLGFADGKVAGSSRSSEEEITAEIVAREGADVKADDFSKVVGGPTIAPGSQLLEAIRKAPGETKRGENTCTRRIGTDVNLGKSSSGRHVAEEVLAELRGLGDRVISGDVTVKDVRHARQPTQETLSYWSSERCRQRCSGSGGYVGRDALPPGDIPSYACGLHVDVLCGCRSIDSDPNSFLKKKEAVMCLFGRSTFNYLADEVWYHVNLEAGEAFVASQMWFAKFPHFVSHHDETCRLIVRNK